VSEKISSADNQQERSLTPDYIVGLVDGEGYFSVSPVFGNYGSYSSYEVKMVFGIDIKKSDGEILERVKQYFGCGRIYLKKDKRKNFSDMIEYQVKDHFSIVSKIIPFFRKYPLQFPSKQRRFKYFTKIGKIVAERKYSTLKGFKKVQELVAKMRQ
jgi:hypothetical protein